MQNQDPTATQDPNEYINQLVQVNSLEQLIDINQNLSTALGTGSTSSGTTGKDAPAAGASSNVAGASAATGAHATAATHKNALAAAQAAQNAASASPAAANVVPSRMAPGNLSVPKTNASAQRVGHALSGQAHANTMPGGTYRTQ
jgi:flagellar basal-body rod modification protein FlgD